MPFSANKLTWVYYAAAKTLLKVITTCVVLRLQNGSQGKDNHYWCRYTLSRVRVQLQSTTVPLEIAHLLSPPLGLFIFPVQYRPATQVHPNVKEPSLMAAISRTMWVLSGVSAVIYGQRSIWSILPGKVHTLNECSTCAVRYVPAPSPKKALAQKT